MRKIKRWNISLANIKNVDPINYLEVLIAMSFALRVKIS
jgi:hypothetical protein